LKLRTLRADLLLLLTAAVWGFAFVAQRVGMEHVGPFIFNGIRFALGCLVLVPFVWIRRHRVGAAGGKGLLVVGLAAGGVLFLGASLQQIGIVYTTAGKAGFITGLYVVLVPLLATIWRHRVGRSAWIGAMLAAVGLYLLSIREGFRISLGDGLVLASAFFWATHVLIISRWSKRHDVILLAVIQFATCSVLSLGVAFLTESFTVQAIRAAGIPILYGGLLSVGLGYTLQVVAQRDAPPTAAAILLSLEAVFAVLGGWLILDETLVPRAMVGCGLMLAGVVLSQIGPEPAADPVDTRVT
jgi:drug/metabolite transporter (DMT)-like permease